MKSKSVLKKIEHIGNALPHPAMMFAMFCVILMVLSQALAFFDIKVVYPILQDGVLVDQHVGVNSLLDGDGIRYMLSNVIENFATFTPLATVLVAMLGVGFAEGSGLISALLTNIVAKTNKRYVTMIVVFAGVMSSIASDAGYVVLIPLGAIVFMRFSRHPLAGIAAAFAGVSGGFSANLFPGPVDAMLSSMTTEASALSLQGGQEVLITDNWFFLIASTILITIVGTLVTEKIVEPMLGEYKGNHKEDAHELSPVEKKGLKVAGISAVIYILIVLALIVPYNGILRNQETHAILNSPFMDSIVVLIVLLFLIPGVAYGMSIGKIKNSKDVVSIMSDTIASMSSYIVLVFFAAQFIKFFAYTNLGTIIAVKGSEFLASIEISSLILIAVFVIITAFINIFMGSASAKWAILSPIFIPMFNNLGYHPALIQMAYRIGDSTTNIITPLMSYFALIIVMMRKYDEDAKTGTLISVMIPYALCLLGAWILLLWAFMVFNIPLGPGVNI